jgi:prevent-host-death family protein
MISDKSKEGTVITATELKKNLGKYLDYVENNNDLVISKNGQKIARLTPYVTDLERYFLVRENTLDYQYGGKKVSYDEFVKINEKSTLRMELINGEIYLLSSPTIIHQELLARLYRAFSDYFDEKKCKVFFAPFDVVLKKKVGDELDVLQPDLLVVCDLPGNVDEKGKYQGTPALVVEILSETTRKKDMIEKLNSYMLSGVDEYWIVDPKQERVLIYNFTDCDIEGFNVSGKGGVADSQLFDELRIDMNGLFDHLLD